MSKYTAQLTAPLTGDPRSDLLLQKSNAERHGPFSPFPFFFSSPPFSSPPSFFSLFSPRRKPFNSHSWARQPRGRIPESYERHQTACSFFPLGPSPAIRAALFQIARTVFTSF